ncbi:MAG TPA: protein-L-isoaspartate(D-aspartate) O-methyltransferase [Prolixibacteraceae bacterium]|nr:protein-L-isoaspartate(D-aspartate) O-methyltransferase [Prolixibacteraceae bacterium]
MTRNEDPRYLGLRKRLVDALKIKGIKDERVLQAIGNVPRHAFLESSFLHYAYRDQAFPIGAGQTISQPYTVAFQTQLLQVEPGCKVLEIGTGSGYQAAVLCEMGVRVYTIERQRELYVKAKALLADLGYDPLVFYGDGYKGLPTYGPFDRILVTAGAPAIPPELKFQLICGGRMVIPVGFEDHQEMMLVVRNSETDFSTEKHGAFIFVPMLKGTVN